MPKNNKKEQKKTEVVYRDPKTGEKRFILKIKTRIRRIYQATGIKLKIIFSFTILTTLIIAVLSFLNWSYQKNNINNMIKTTAEVSIQTLNKSLSEYIVVGTSMEYQLLLKKFMDKPIDGLKEVVLYDMIHNKKATSLSLDLTSLNEDQIEKYKTFPAKENVVSSKGELIVKGPIVAFVAKEVKKEIKPEPVQANKDLKIKETENPKVQDVKKQPVKQQPKKNIKAAKGKPQPKKVEPKKEEPQYKIEYIQEEKYLGTVEFIFDQDVLYEPIRKSTAILLKIALYVLLAGIIGVLIFALFLTKPITLLQKGVLNVTKGNLEFKIQIKSNDELGYLSQQFNEMVMSLKEKLEMQKFVSDKTVAAIKGKIRDNQELETHKEELTVLFSDIRGFTAMSETMQPEEIINLLNVYFEDLSQIIMDHGGDIDKYVGDEIFAIFRGEGKERNALMASIGMQKAVDKINQENKTSIAIGIGINTGEAVLGSMGSSVRKDYTAIGDNVNIGARLCSNAYKGEIVISQTTYEKLKDEFQLEKKGNFELKGKSQPVPIYRAVF